MKEKGGIHISEKKEHILACIDATPLSEQIIERARIAAEFRGAKMTILLIQSGSQTAHSKENELRIRELSSLSESLGCDMEILGGNDPADLIAEFARLSNATQIVMGCHLSNERKHLFLKTLPERIASRLPAVEIRLISDQNAAAAAGLNLPLFPDKRSLGRIILSICSIMCAATLIGLMLQMFSLAHDSIIPIYTLAVVLCCLVSPTIASCIASALLSIGLYCLFFVRSGAVFSGDVLFLCLIMLITSLITGLLVSSIKRHDQLSAENIYREKVLFDASEMLLKTDTPAQVYKILISQIGLLAKKDTLFMEYDGNAFHKNYFQPAGGKDPHSMQKMQQEKAAAQKAARSDASVYGGTETYGIYYPCRTAERTLGVIGIAQDEKPIDPMTTQIIKAIINKAAITAENQILALEMEEVRSKASNETMKANLLRAISHDLRTPLTSISGNLDNLIKNEGRFDLQTRHNIYTDTFENTAWLINMVENLLSASRLEDGKMAIHAGYEVLSDIVDEAVRSAKNHKVRHDLVVQDSDDLLIVNADAQLIVRVLNNIISNAYEYTPEDTRIVVSLKTENGMAVIEVADSGPGIAEEHRDKIFEMFYMADQVTDSRRSMGLGLYLCKKIVEAHHGTISLRPNQPHGCIFSFSLPLADLSGLNTAF